MNRGLLVVTLLMSASLAACGGGGSAGGVIPSQPQSHSPKLGAGFAVSVSGGGATSLQHRTFTPKMRTMSDPVLTGALIPFADYWVPDSYVAPNSFSTVGYSAVAYLDTSNGSTLPNPLPTVTFTQTGSQLPLVGPYQPGPSNVATQTVIGGEILGSPTATGQTTVTASALGQSINLAANSYPGFALDSSYLTRNPQGLTFTPSGAVPTTSGTPDIAIDASTEPSTLVVPGGIEMVAQGKFIDQVTTADFDPTKAVTRLSTTYICSGIFDFIMKTPSGLIVKFENSSATGRNVASNVCHFDEIDDSYQVAGTSGFAY